MFSEIQKWIINFFVHRYYVIVHPLKSQYLCTISKAKKTVVITWILAFLLAIPIILVQVHMEVGHRIRAFWCVRNFDSPMKWQIQVKKFDRPLYLELSHNKNSKLKPYFALSFILSNFTWTMKEKFYLSLNHPLCNARSEHKRDFQFFLVFLRYVCASENIGLSY